MKFYQQLPLDQDFQVNLVNPDLTIKNSARKEEILVVDDTRANLKLISDFLGESGFEVRIAKSGLQALKVIEKASPNLILLDVMMPEMDGFETCRHLKACQKTQDIPVIFMTAMADFANPENKVKGLTLGAVDYISKPIQLEEVLARVKTHLRLRSLTKQLEEQNALLQHEILSRKQTELILQQEIGDRQQAEAALRQSEAREREKARQLELALGELKRTQVQLIQAEKMSSLGRMIAGIAHEINNPVSFIYGNLTPAKEYFKELTHLIELYQQNYPNPSLEIRQFTERIDLGFLIEDWSKLIHSMQVGAERIEQIVLSLKSFSRLDEAELKFVDISESIENTLLILQNRLRAEGNSPEIKVIKKYSQLPPVICYASQLNQVFINLLNNAIDALENQPSPRVITISTSMLTKALPIPNSQFAVIRIADNGPGISEDVRQQMFDPFFTTKPIGSGTGLGLAISHQIVVEKHKGQISCVSAPGQGTELIMEIPVNLTTLSNS